MEFREVCEGKGGSEIILQGEFRENISIICAKGVRTRCFFLASLFDIDKC